MESDARSQFNRSLCAHVKQLTATFASPVTNFRASKSKEKLIAAAAQTTSFPAGNSRAKTPQPAFLLNPTQAVHKEDAYSRLHYDYLKVQRNKSSAGKYTAKCKAAKRPPAMKTRQHSRDYGSSAACPLEFDKENLYPGGEDGKYNNLVALVNKERETVNNMKAELQRVCLESRKEKSKLQREIEELNIKNAELIKVHNRERNKLHEKCDALYYCIKTLTNAFVEKLLFMQNINHNTEFHHTKGYNPISEMKELFVKELERVRALEFDIDFSQELSRLRDITNKAVKAERLQAWAETRLEKIQEEAMERANTASTYKNAGECLAWEETRVKTSVPFQCSKQSLLLRTLEDINASVSELALTEDSADVPVKSKASDNSKGSIMKKESKATNNAIKQLEEIKARILNRQRKLQHKQ